MYLFYVYKYTQEEEQRMDPVEATKKKIRSGEEKRILEAIVLLCWNNAIAKDKNLFAVKRMERRKEKRQDKRKEKEVMV